jgi:hypothetical protein
MDRKPFEPIDTVPRWQKLYDLVMARNAGDEVTYGEAIDLLGLTGRRAADALKIAQDTMRTAVAHLEKGGQRTVGTVTRFGWIVLDAQRELNQVDRRLVKTRRAAGRTLRGAQALGTRREELSQFERERLDRMTRAARMTTEITGRKASTMEGLRKALEG